MSNESYDSPLLDILDNGLDALLNGDGFDPIPIASTTMDLSNETPIERTEGVAVAAVGAGPATIEPTPIGTNIDVVDSVPLTSAPWLQSKTLAKMMLPLLNEQVQQQKRQNLKVVDDNFLKTNPFSSSSDEESVTQSTGSLESDSNFRPSHLEQWNERYKELVEFKSRFNHCLVPLVWPENPGLSHWVKRQRHQYILKTEGKHSTLTEERERVLESLGFIWNSHAAAWEERRQELENFRNKHGHCFVPTKFPENPKLSIWVKCQRRQYKLFEAGRRSNMTKERIAKLLELGFEFHPRSAQKRPSSSPSLMTTASNTAAGVAAASIGRTMNIDRTANHAPPRPTTSFENLFSI